MCNQVVQKIDTLIRSGIPIIAIDSVEEERVESELRLLAQKRNRRLVVWSATAGFAQVEPQAQKLQPLKDIVAAIQSIVDGIPETGVAPATLYVLRDAHHFFKLSPIIVRAFRDVAFKLCQIQAKGSNIVILGGGIVIPEALQKDVVLLDFPLPTAHELGEQLAAFVANLPPEISVNLSDADQTALIYSLTGLAKKGADAALSQAAVTYRQLDNRAIDFVDEVKKGVIAQNKSMGYHTNESLDDLGGWDEFKEYSARVRLSRTAKAREMGITPHKGIFLVGAPGCGKSLASTMLADPGMPVITWNLAATKSKWVGESGENLRAGFKLLEVIAPCVVILDEVDKVYSTSGGDGGLSGNNTSVEQLGEFLTWMQDHRDNGVFIVATANYVAGIDPAFINRFNKSFFVDFPVEAERREIFAIHLRKKGYDAANFDLAALVKASDGFNGREIEMLVNEGLITALAHDHAFCSADILEELAQAIPLSTTMEKQLAAMREWSAQASPVSSQQQSGNQAATNAAQRLEF